MSTAPAPEKGDFIAKYGPGIVGTIAAGCAFTFFITLPAGKEVKDSLEHYFHLNNEGDDHYCSSQLKQCSNKTHN